MIKTSLNLNTNIKLENQRQEPKMCITNIHSLWVKSGQ
jgi:hypothetical protein